MSTATLERPELDATVDQQELDIPSVMELEAQFRLKLKKDEVSEQVHEQTQKEKPGLSEKLKSIAGKFKETLKSAFEMVGRPIKFLREQINKHPIITTVIIIGMVVAWYYSAPLAYGLSGLMEAASDITGEVLEKSLEIDPTQVGRVLATV